MVTSGRGSLRWREGPEAASRRGAPREHGPGLPAARLSVLSLSFGMRHQRGGVSLVAALRCTCGCARRRGGLSRCAWLSTCPRRWLMSMTASRPGFARRHPGHGCSGRAAQALKRAGGGVLACCASSALTVNVGGGQVSWSTLRVRARMFCYWTFTHPYSITVIGPVAASQALCTCACVPWNVWSCVSCGGTRRSVAECPVRTLRPTCSRARLQ